MLIRIEKEDDKAAVYQINAAAFETTAEANLVDVLREQAEPTISLVAENDATVIGHIMFSPVTLSTDPDLKLMGLAPMAVIPAGQSQGIGSALVRAGIEHCKELGFRAVVVLGHSEYYPRFGFVPASRFNLRWEYDVPDEVFMAMELEPGAFDGKSGVVKYHAAFSNV